MLAKLFNNISIQSLVRAMGFSLLSILAITLAEPVSDASFTFGAEVYEISGFWYKGILGFVLFISGWWLNSSINRLGFLKNDYQFWPVFTLLSLPLFFFTTALEYVLVIPFGILLLLRLLSISKKTESAYALFDAGTLTGIMTVLIPESILFILIAWVAVLSFGRIHFRAFLMPLVGLLAVWFVIFTVMFWLADQEVADMVPALLAAVKIGVSPRISDPNWWKSLPMILAAIPAFFEMLQVYGKANNFKRQTFTFLLMFFLLFLVAGVFVKEHSRLWMWLGIPLSVFIVNLIHYLRKAWFKDIIYGLLILALVLFAFV